MFFIIGLVILLLYFVYKNKVKGVYSYTKAVTCLLIVLSTIRHTFTTVDSYGYVRNYKASVSKSWRDVFSNFWENYFHPGELGKDPGYDVLEKLFASISDNEFFFFFITAIVAIIPIYYVWKRYARSPFEVLVSSLFYLNFFYSLIPNAAARQTVAFGCVLVGCLFLQKGTKKGTILFFLFVILASFFHQSALIAFALLFLKYIKSLKIILFASVGVFVAMLFLYQVVFSFIGLTNEIYHAYGESDFYDLTTGKPYMSLLFYAFFFFLVIINYKYETKFKKNKIFYTGGAMSFVLMPIIWLDPSAVRIVAYFGIWFSLLIPHIINLVPDSRKQIYMYIIIAALFLRLLISPLNYYFFWQDVPMPMYY